MDDKLISISVIIPTWKRPEQLHQTLKIIMECNPCPFEILVHVDGGDNESENKIKKNFPQVRIYKSAIRQGPGGGRNILARAAEGEIIASFDDDSYPLDKDYFSRLSALFNNYPDASVIACEIVHRNEPALNARKMICPAIGFVNCGSAIRKRDFIEAGGYVALPLAYGMEEADLALRLLARGKKIYFSPWLRVYHDTDRRHQASPEINAAAISNVALLTYLRYPLSYWPYGLLQLFNRVIWSIRAGRFRGILSGLTGIPAYLWRYRKYRAPIPVSVFRDVLKMIRQGTGPEMPIFAGTK